MNSSNNYIMLKAKQNYLNKKSMPLDTNNNTILTQQNAITNDTQEEAGFLEKGWETLVDVGGNFVGGVSKGVEGIVDYLVGTVAQGGSGVLSKVIVNLYDDNFKKSLQDIIEYDWTTKHILDPVSEWTQDSYINDASTKAQEIIRGIASGVGEIIPAAALTYATGGTNLVGTVAFGASAAGQAAEQALNEGATMDEAMLYGTASGGVETGIEALSGGVSKFFMGKGATSKFINKATSKIKNKAVKKIFKVGLETVGEGVEEIASDIADPYLQRIYKDADEIEKPTLEDLGTSFLIGAAVSLAYNGTIGKIGSRKKAIVENLDKLQNNKTDFNTKTTLTETDINEYQETMEDLNLDIEYDLKKLSAKTREKTISFLNEQGMDWFNTDGSIDYDKMQQGLELDLNYDIQEIANFDISQETKATTAQMQETKNLFNILKEQSNKLNDTKIFFDNSLPKNIEGFYNPQTKTIVINKNSKASYKTILKHELTHTLEGTKEYATLFDYSMKYLKERGEYETIRKELEKIYEKNLEKLDAQSKEKYTNEEMMSIFSERLFEDEASIKRITQENRSLIQKIYDWIKNKIKLFKGTNKEERKIKQELQKIEKLYKEALEKNSDINTVNTVNTVKKTTKYKKINTVDTVETKASKFQDKSVPKWAKSAMLDKETIKTIEEMKTYYVPETDKAAKEYIKTTLPNMEQDYKSYVKTYITNIENGLVRSKKDIAVGIALIEESIKRKDFANYSKLSINLTILGTELGQQVQAFNLLNNLTPKGELYYIQQYVKRFNAKTKNPNSKLKINQTYVEELKNVTTQEQKEQVVEKIIVDLAKQQPATLWEKITNWRYLAMLGNFKTHVRNLVGNTVMRGITKVKNTIARGIENNLIERGKMLESQRVYAPQKYISLKVKEFAKNDTQEVIGRLTSGSKFNEKGNAQNITKSKISDISSKIQDKRVIFNTKLLENTRKFNFAMMEKEDFIFLKSSYQDALSQYLTARNIDIDTLKDPSKAHVLEQAREYAINVAQETTFRKFSYLAQTINNIKAKSKLHQMIIEGIVPFAKTPINILKTGINYSPIGLANAVFFQTRQLKNGNITINQYIDSLAKGLTGSMITALGYALSQLGLISIGADDEKENKYISDLGTQDYSLNVAGMSFTLDWISPASIPFFIGVAMQESFEKDGVANVEGIVGAIASSADPLTDLSMLSSLNSTLKTYSDNRIGGMTKQIVKNFFAQMFPTALSQVAKTFDTKRRTTATTAKNEYGIGKEYVQYINYLKAKIPFLNNTLEPYINIWGQEETNPNFIENALENLAYPFWVSNSKVDSIVDNEIMSLYQQTGNKDVLPSTPNSYYTLDGVRHDLTPEEYTQYKKDFGTFSFNQLKVLFSSETYKNMSNEEKEKTIQTVYSYARDFSRKGKYFELFSALKTNGNQNNLSTFLVTIDNFTADLDENGNTIPNSRKKKVYNYINSLKLTRKQKILLFEFVGYSSSNISALSTNEKAKHPLLG